MALIAVPANLADLADRDPEEFARSKLVPHERAQDQAIFEVPMLHAE